MKTRLNILTMVMIPLSFLMFAVSATSSAQPLQSKAIVKKILEKDASAKGYEVDVKRVKSKWTAKGSFSELRTKTKAQVMDNSQEKRSLQYKVIRSHDARIKHKISRGKIAGNNQTKKAGAFGQEQKAVSEDQLPESDEQEALFTVDPDALFARYEESNITELSRTNDQVVLAVGPPPGPAPDDWPDMWLRATFDVKRDVLIKSELMVEDEARIITDFSYRLVDSKHWLPSQKTIRVIETDAVTVIEDNFEAYQKIQK